MNNKLLKKLKSNEEAIAVLKSYASNMENIMKKIATANQNKEIFRIIGDWLNQIQKVPLERIRQVLYNVERFRADAFKLPEVHMS